MKKLSMIIALLISIFFASCRKHSLTGEGPVVNETRELPSFTSVVADGSIDVVVHPSNANRAVVSGYSNLVPQYETEVNSSGKLRLKFRDKFINVHHNNIKVDVYTTGISSYTINGSGNTTIRQGLTAENMDLDINGSGDIHVEQNKFLNMNCKVNGSGNIHAQSCTTDHANVNISGSGNVKLTVLKTLSVRISGSGDVDYWGSPQITKMDVSGSGDIKKRD
jgi:hypothetical protein